MGSIVGALRNPSRIFYGWRMMAILNVMGALNHAFFFKGTALFLIPVESHLGLSRATSSLIFSISRSEGAVEGPVLGYLVDRYGAKKMMIIGVILAGVGFLWFATSTNVWTFIVAFLVFVSLGATMAFSHAMNATINMWFSRFRVRALAVHEATGSLADTIILPLMGLIIVRYGWQWAAVAAGVAYIVIILPLTRFLKESPESVGLMPDGATPEEVERARRAAAETDSASARLVLRYYEAVDFTVGEALRTSSYWFLLTGTMFRQAAKAAISVHVIAILVWKGQDLTQATLILALSLGMAVPFKLFFGYIGDRVSKPMVLGGAMLVYALGLAMLLPWESAWVLFAALLLTGLAEGVTSLNWAAFGDYFGRKYYATLRGICNLSYSWAIVLIPFAAGWWFDREQSYTLTLVASAVAALVAAVLYSLMRRPAPPVRSAPRRRVSQGPAAG